MDTLTIVGGVVVVAMIAFIVWKAKQPKKNLNPDKPVVPTKPKDRKGTRRGGKR